MKMKLLVIFCVMLFITLKVFAQPSFTVNPSLLNFGENAAGHTTTKTFTIKNTSNIICNVSIKNWQSDFIISVSPRDVTISPNHTITFTVKVEYPNQVDQYYELLWFTYQSSIPYYYGIREASHIYLKTITVPSQPRNLNVTNITSTGCTLFWSPPVSGPVQGYRVYRMSSGVPTLIGSTNSENITVSLPSGLVSNFEVRAFNNAGESSPASISVLALPAAPTNLSFNNASTTGFTATWTASTGATGYNVYLNGTKYVTASTSYTFSNLSPGTNYSVSVRAHNATGESTTGITRSFITLPPAPTNFVATIHSSTWVDLSWSPSFGATCYYLNWGGNILTTNATNTSIYGPNVYNQLYTLWASNSSGASTQVILDLSDGRRSQIDIGMEKSVRQTLNNITFYPNPASSKVWIDNEDNSPMSVELWSITGQLVLSKVNVSSNEPVDISPLAKGLYIIKVNNNGSYSSHKIIITD